MWHLWVPAEVNVVFFALTGASARELLHSFNVAGLSPSSVKLPSCVIQMFKPQEHLSGMWQGSLLTPVGMSFPIMSLRRL